VTAALDASGRYHDVAAGLEAHLGVCGRCANGNLCDQGSGLLEAEARAWTAFELADPGAAGDYDRTHTPR
jgi:hypothetical protein